MDPRNGKTGSLLTLMFLALLMIAVNCTDSCYKDESNFADAGNATTAPTGETTDSDGCRVGDVYYQVDMVHPDRPCLICSYLDDNISVGWVPLVDGSPCDDGKFCTGDGACDRGRCIFEGNPCPADAPYCMEAYGGVCTDDPNGDDDVVVDDDDTTSDDDDAIDDDDLVLNDDDCWTCAGTIDCIYLFGDDWGCLDGCCVIVGDDDDSIADDDDAIADDDDLIG